MGKMKILIRLNCRYSRIAYTLNTQKIGGVWSRISEEFCVEEPSTREYAMQFFTYSLLTSHRKHLNPIVEMTALASNLI